MKLSKVIKECKEAASALMQYSKETLENLMNNLILKPLKALYNEFEELCGNIAKEFMHTMKELAKMFKNLTKSIKKALKYMKIAIKNFLGNILCFPLDSFIALHRLGTRFKRVRHDH